MHRSHVNLSRLASLNQGKPVAVLAFADYALLTLEADGIHVGRRLQFCKESFDRPHLPKPRLEQEIVMHRGA